MPRPLFALELGHGKYHFRLVEKRETSFPGLAVYTLDEPLPLGTSTSEIDTTGVDPYLVISSIERGSIKLLIDWLICLHAELALYEKSKEAANEPL